MTADEIRKLDELIRDHVESDASFEFIKGLRCGAEFLAKIRDADTGEIHDD